MKKKKKQQSTGDVGRTVQIKVLTKFDHSKPNNGKSLKLGGKNVKAWEKGGARGVS